MAVKNTSNNNGALISYWTLRKVIGGIGIALPILLVAGKMTVHWICPECGSFKGEFNPDFVQVSISSYYWTAVGDILVSSLAAIGIFLFAYRGPHGEDNLPGNIACFAALGVALFPTTPGNSTEISNVGITHYISAAVLFGTLAYFCLVVFQRPDIEGSDDLKPTRNRLYFVCGLTIIGCIAAIALVQLLVKLERMAPGFWVFIFESVAVWAFGWSWLVKGAGFNLLREKTPPSAS